MLERRVKAAGVFGICPCSRTSPRLLPSAKATEISLAQNESAVEVLGNQELRIIATELVKSVRESSGVDWWQRDDVRAKMRVAVKRILRRHGYPPDLQSEAVKLVIKQAEALARAVA